MQRLTLACIVWFVTPNDAASDTIMCGVASAATSSRGKSVTPVLMDISSTSLSRQKVGGCVSIHCFGANGVPVSAFLGRFNQCAEKAVCLPRVSVA